jgi:hypothetical protein
MSPLMVLLWLLEAVLLLHPTLSLNTSLGNKTWPQSTCHWIRTMKLSRRSLIYANLISTNTAPLVSVSHIPTNASFGVAWHQAHLAQRSLAGGHDPRVPGLSRWATSSFPPLQMHRTHSPWLLLWVPPLLHCSFPTWKSARTFHMMASQ